MAATENQRKFNTWRGPAPAKGNQNLRAILSQIFAAQVGDCDKLVTDKQVSVAAYGTKEVSPELAIDLEDAKAGIYVEEIGGKYRLSGHGITMMNIGNEYPSPIPSEGSWNASRRKRYLGAKKATGAMGADTQIRMRGK
jgi:hypothetical protein